MVHSYCGKIGQTPYVSISKISLGKNKKSKYKLKQNKKGLRSCQRPFIIIALRNERAVYPLLLLSQVYWLDPIQKDGCGFPNYRPQTSPFQFSISWVFFGCGNFFFSALRFITTFKTFLDLTLTFQGMSYFFAG